MGGIQVITGALVLNNLESYLEVMQKELHQKVHLTIDNYTFM